MILPDDNKAKVKIVHTSLRDFSTSLKRSQHDGEAGERCEGHGEWLDVLMVGGFDVGWSAGGE